MLYFTQTVSQELTLLSFQLFSLGLNVLVPSCLPFLESLLSYVSLLDSCGLLVLIKLTHFPICSEFPENVSLFTGECAVPGIMTNQ